jgi:hypothetical protein
MFHAASSFRNLAVDNAYRPVGASRQCEVMSHHDHRPILPRQVPQDREYLIGRD